MKPEKRDEHVSLLGHVASLEYIRPTALVASVTMGYGHLRAAHPLAETLNTEVVAVDAAPIAAPSEASLWHGLKTMHEVLSKPLPMLSFLDGPARGLMNSFTQIPPLHEPRAHHEPTWAVRLLDVLIGRGLGRGLVEELHAGNRPLLTTFYAPAIIADRAGRRKVYCVVTDADCNRVWAPLDPTRSRIQYLAPTPRVVRRLRSFGVAEGNIQLTGFPLPQSLVSNAHGKGVKARFARRLVRLDPTGVFRKLYANELASLMPNFPRTGDEGPLTLMFAVGGAGAQADVPAQFLPSLRPKILRGEIHLQLVAGTRLDVRGAFLKALHANGLGHTVGREVRIVEGKTFEGYYAALNRALLQTDILWTKPSEMSFYPALGIPCIIGPSVGAHERYNGAWLREQGVGLKQRSPARVLGWLTEWLEDGTLAGAAWSGFTRLPKHATALISAAVSK